MMFTRAFLDHKWNKLVKDSPQGSVFATKAFLECYKYAAYYLYKGEQLLAGVYGIEDGKSLVLAPHMIHSGVLFAPIVGRNTAQTNALKFEILERIITHLTALYDNISFNLHPSITDIRPFLWYNYDEGRKFKINVRYTSYLSLENDFDTLYGECSNSKKQAIRENGTETSRVFAPLALIELYKETMAKQNVPPETNLMLSTMQSLHECDKLRMFKTEQNGKIGSITAFGIHNDIAYSLYGAGTLGNCGTHVLWQGMKELAQEGIKIVDLEGINSPMRGAFKVSFGGSITPYYQVNLC